MLHPKWRESRSARATKVRTGFDAFQYHTIAGRAKNGRRRKHAARRKRKSNGQDGVAFEGKRCRFRASYRVVAVVTATVSAIVFGKHVVEGVQKAAPVVKAIFGGRRNRG